MILTAARIILGCRIPLFLRGEFVADDFLMVRYAESLLEGKWLGDFRGATLTKDVGYAIYLAIFRKLNIPYTFGNTLFYCICLLLFCLAIYKLFPNIYACFALYAYLLFSPIMLNEDAIQKAYRAGFLSSVTLFLLGTVIGLYGVVLRGQHVVRMIFWSFMASFALICFWFTKEDGIWLAPFVLCGLFIAGGTLASGCRKKKGRKTGSICRHIVIGFICLVMPIVCLAAASFAVRSINYKHYGEFAVTDRNDTYYSKVISDLYHVDDGEQSLLIWLSREGLNKAFEASPTLAESKPYIDGMYQISWAVTPDGEMHGDNIYWALREAVEAGGLYKQGGKAVNEYYRRIHEELTAAFEEGRLPKDTESIYISSGGRGMTMEEIKWYFPRKIPKAISMMVRYQENITAATPATGDEEHVQRMAAMLDSPYVASDGSNASDFAAGIALAVGVTALYSAIGVPVTVMAAIGFILSAVLMLAGLFRGDFKRVPILLVMAGMGLSGGLYTFAILWFCAWHTMKLAYEYLGGVILIMNVLQVVGVALLAEAGVGFFASLGRTKKRHAG